MSMKDAYEQKIEAQLAEWDAEIKKLRAKAEQAEADAKIQYQKQVEDIRSMQRSAQAKLEELKEAGDNAWEDLKAGMENARDSLAKAIRDATSRFS